MFSNRRIFSMNAWYNERGYTTAVSCCKTFIIKNPCATLEKLLQHPRFTIQVHTIYNSPWHTIYNAHTDYNPGIRFTTPIQFTIWKTIGFCCFKKQQKCDYCREKSSWHNVCDPERRKSWVSFVGCWACLIYICLTVYEFSSIFLFISMLNYVLIVTFWILTYDIILIVNYPLFYMKLLNYLFCNMFGSIVECYELTGVSLLWTMRALANKAKIGLVWKKLGFIKKFTLIVF